MKSNRHISWMQQKLKAINKPTKMLYRKPSVYRPLCCQQPRCCSLSVLFMLLIILQPFSFLAVVKSSVSAAEHHDHHSRCQLTATTTKPKPSQVLLYDHRHLCDARWQGCIWHEEETKASWLLLRLWYCFRIGLTLTKCNLLNPCTKVHLRLLPRQSTSMTDDEYSNCFLGCSIRIVMSHNWFCVSERR